MGVKPGTEKLKRLLEMGMLIILIMDDGNKGQSNRGWPKRTWEKDAEVWMGGGSVWRVGLTAEDRLEDPSKQQCSESDKRKRERAEEKK